MQTDLANGKCEACSKNAILLSANKINELKDQIPSWIIYHDDEDDIQKLACSFSFLNYKDSVEFANKIATLAEEEDHHPQINLEWGKVTVIWWSHEIKGLHINDFICAKKTDLLFESNN